MQQKLKDTLMKLPPLRMLRAVKQQFDAIKKLEAQTQGKILRSVIDSSDGGVFEFKAVIKKQTNDGSGRVETPVRMRVKNGHLLALPEYVDDRFTQPAAEVVLTYMGNFVVGDDPDAELIIDKSFMRDVKAAYSLGEELSSAYVATLVEQRKGLTGLEESLTAILQTLVVRGNDKFTVGSPEVMFAVQEIKKNDPALEREAEVVKNIEAAMFEAAKSRYDLRIAGEVIYPYGNDEYGRDMLPTAKYVESQAALGKFSYPTAEEVATLKNNLNLVSRFERIISSAVSGMKLDFNDVRTLAFKATSATLAFEPSETQHAVVVNFVAKHFPQYCAGKRSVAESVGGVDTKHNLMQELSQVLEREVAASEVVEIGKEPISVPDIPQ